MTIPSVQVLAAENRPNTTILIDPLGLPYSASSFTSSVVPVPWTNRSGSITTGGTAVQAAAANAVRKGFCIQNTSAGDLWYSTEAVAVIGSPSFKLVANAYYENPVGLPPGGAISVIGATTAQTFTCREY